MAKDSLSGVASADLLLRLHTTRCVWYSVGRDSYPSSRCRTQGSLATPNELVGCPNRPMAPRDPAKGPAETQNLCQNRETTERRELWRRHHFLALRGQVRLGGVGTR